MERYKIFVLLLFINVTTFMIRFALTVAILDMVETKNGTTINNNTCSTNETSTITSISFTTLNGITQTDDRKFNWSEKDQALLFGCFYYGYALTVWPFGVLSDMFGARYILFFSLFASSVCGLLYPVAAYHGINYLIAVRIIQGLVQGGVFTSQTSLWGRWSPVSERTFLLGISQMVALLGNAFGNALTALICERLGWEWSFYIFSAMGIVLSLIWVAYFRNSPAEMSWISREEVELIAHGQTSTPKVPLAAIPIRKILTSASFMSVVYTGVSVGMIDFTFIAMIPKYLKQALGSGLLADGILSGLPFIFQFIVVVIACFGVDRVIKSGRFDKTRIRKLAFALGLIPPIIILCFITPAKCNDTVVVVLLCVSYGIQGFQAAATIPSMLDMAPCLGGFLHGMVDLVYSSMGFINPLIASAIISKDPYSISSWTPLWYICSAIGASGLVLFCACVKSEEQPWAKIAEQQKK